MAQKINYKQRSPSIVKAYITANVTQTSSGTAYGSGIKVSLNAIDNTLAPEFTLVSNEIAIPAGVSYVRVSLILTAGSTTTATEQYASIRINGSGGVTSYFPTINSGTGVRHWACDDFFPVVEGDKIGVYYTNSSASQSVRFDTGTRLIVEAIG